jgi:hypothetical protein
MGGAVAHADNAKAAKQAEIRIHCSSPPSLADRADRASDCNGPAPA